MSFILDALKKSESDRQRQSGPSLFEVKVAPPRRRLPVWAGAIAVLLGINIVVISWMLLRHPTAPQAAPASAPAAAPAPATVPARAAAATPGGTMAAPNMASPAPAPAAAASGKTVPVPTAGGPASSPERPAVTSPNEGSGAHAGDTDRSAAEPPAADDPSDYAPAAEPSAARDAGASAGTANGLPLYQQVVAGAGLPALHLDLHVYADSPKDRFVMINMHRLGEGDSLPNGVHVEAIRPDGVELSYQGTRFLLPRN
ncbi:MAG TPA: general secretion pathway protein GspB [Steroidobacteraceae bacterium]|nr:general secretion pathway protein GspB [Steroidobacteraceae bacterium]